jgi:shikimate dehydrogenase
VVLGAGGASRAILVALQTLGVPEIRVVNRTLERALALADELGAPLVAIPWAERESALRDTVLLINTTTLGMQGQPPLDLRLNDLPRTAVVNDIVYAPLQTKLLQAAQARGNATVDGLEMLLHQARPGFRAWFGREPDVTDELRRFVGEDLL